MIKGRVCWGFLFVFVLLLYFFLSARDWTHPIFYYLFVFVGICVYACGNLRGQKSWIPWSWVRAGCDVLIVVAWNLTVALWRSSAQSELWNHIFILRPRIFHVRQALHWAMETELGFPQQRGFKEKWSHRGNETLGRELWISVWEHSYLPGGQGERGLAHEETKKSVCIRKLGFL